MTYSYRDCASEVEEELCHGFRESESERTIYSM